jgi:Flp pilus assembly protein TadD
VPAAPSPEFEMTRVNIAAAFVGAAMLLAPFAAIAVDNDENPAAVELDPDYAAGKKAIEAKQWSAAIAVLSSAALRDTRNADIQNYLGYAYRNAGQLDAAFRHYERALTLSPRHRGAHEYVGEAYLIVNNLAKAEEHLTALQQICLIPCEEFEELKEKIEAYKRSGKR